MVKLKVSFDKSWGETNDIEITACKGYSLGRTGSEKMGALIPKYLQL
jgi:hypothetical protein